MLFDPSKFTLKCVSGTRKTTKCKHVTKGVLRRKVTEEVEVIEPFEITDIQPSTVLPNKDDSVKYDWLYVGTFELQRAYVYLAHDRYAMVSEFTCYSLHLIGHNCVNVNTGFVSLKIDPTIADPRADVEFSKVKSCKRKEYQQLHSVQLRFASREQMNNYISSLEPADSVVVAKLTKAT